MLNLGLDVDGVLADYTYSLTSAAKTLGLIDNAYGTRRQKSWDYPFDRQAVIQCVDAIPNWWMTIEPLVTCSQVDALLDVCQDSYNIHFISARPPYARGLRTDYQTSLWLQSVAHFPRYICNNVACLGSIENKVECCLKWGIDILIDDNPDVVRSMIQNGRKAYLYLQPYNIDAVDVPSVHGWNGMLNVLKKAAKTPCKCDQCVCGKV